MIPSFLRIAALVSILMLPPSVVLAEPVLSVAQVSGGVRVNHLGETRLAQVGEELQDRDVVRLDDDAYLSLRFSHEGALELGPGAALAIERLPAAEDTTDLRSIFSLWKGYMHVVWRHPPAAPWPLYVYFGGQRSSLVDGEYFFQRDGARTRSCVAAGRLAVSAISGDGVETLRPSACYEMVGAGEPKAQVRAVDSWVAIREAFSLDPGRPRPVAVFAEVAPVQPAASAGADAQPPLAAAAATPTPATPPTPSVSKPAAVIAPSASVSAVAETTQSSEGIWAILIGSYADPQNAAQVQQKLAAAGYKPFLRVKTVEGKTFNSVQIRGIATRERAEEQMSAIVARFSLPNLRVVQLQ